MDFALTEEQRMLADSVNRFLEADCPIDAVREAADSGSTKLASVWNGLVSLGVPGLIVPEEYGGVGLGMLEAALITEALGAAAAPVPFVASSIMAPVALMAAGSETQRDEVLSAIAAGESICGVGISEAVGARESGGITASNGTLSGKAMFVLEGVDADRLLFAAADGSLHLTSANASGLSRQALTTIDKTRSVAEVTLSNVAADVLPGSVGNREPLLHTIDIGRLMLAADTLGAAQHMLDEAVAYAKERQQFNRVIGSFQAVKHMCAEMAAELEPCRSLIWYAAHAVAHMPDEVRVMACHAKAHLSETGKFVSRTATEVHGGMGFTDLLGLHYWFKRIGFNRQLLGSPELVREEAAAAQGW